MATPKEKTDTRKKRADAGSVKITARDEQILRFITEQDEVSVPQLQILLARYNDKNPQPTVSQSRAIQVARRWERVGWCAYRNPFRDPNRPASVYATRKGIKECGYDFKFRERDLLSLPHLFAVNDVRIWLEAWAKSNGYTNFKWTSERELRNTHTWSKYPDAEIRYGKAFVAIEVEISRKSKQAYEGIKAMYAGEGFDRAYQYNDRWYFHAEGLGGVLQEVLGDSFKYISLDALQLVSD